MKRKDIEKIISELSDEIDLIEDDKIKKIHKTLFNLVEYLMAENDKLREENQKLRDENNRLKGEQGQPSIRKQSKGADHSSEKDRKPRGQQPKKKKSKKKKDKIKIDRTEICDVDKSQLPPDATKHLLLTCH